MRFLFDGKGWWLLDLAMVLLTMKQFENLIKCIFQFFKFKHIFAHFNIYNNKIIVFCIDIQIDMITMTISMASLDLNVLYYK